MVAARLRRAIARSNRKYGVLADRSRRHEVEYLIIIEPAEPEPPPAHLIGRIGEDVMGRSGQLVRPCWLEAGGVAGGEQLVARLVVRLVRASIL